ncbi:hypothetical protein JW826_03385 [Candidatus Woesearchaeota archaeon]|nr:hypothetical protein [Candidatus Woesearchaeota archaeon]
MFDYKRFAMVLGVMILLPLFIGLFFDAIYLEPKYEDFCSGDRYSMPEKAMPASCIEPPSQLKCVSKGLSPDGSQLFDCENTGSGVKCDDTFATPEVKDCLKNEGSPEFSTDDSCCQVFESCNYCSRDYQQVLKVYNRNLFFILAPVGLVVIIIGIMWGVEYMGAGFMFGGLITLFYATIRYFSEMSKLLRAIVILIELLIIIWLGLKKIGAGREGSEAVLVGKSARQKRRR